ncbi:MULTISPECIES: hypothetical protein [unclassified Nocardiopsis]|uniref:hypothetical protein n=1 Tax=unclassified Nocardiopsis TaxID=2649073 RepID=UPI001F5BB394|nr:hypothetical protein [Nocardiopsis sp. TSRI0078]
MRRRRRPGAGSGARPDGLVGPSGAPFFRSARDGGAPVTPPVCGETSLDRDTRHLVCVLDTGHDGDHQDARGTRWEPPRTTLVRLRRRWGRTHRVAWTGSYWVATARDRRVRWRSHIEPTPDQLEADLRRHTGHPPVPAPRGHRDRL